MPRLQRLALTALALATALTLAACVPEPPDPPDESPVPTAEPLFSSDEEALAAAEDAFERYLETIDKISQDGGDNPERLLEVATADVLQFESAGFERARSSGYRSTGRRSFDSVRLQHALLEGGAKTDVVAIYVCVDLSDVDVVNRRNESIVVESRDDRVAEEVTFDVADSDRLVVSSTSDWTGEDFCG